MFGEIFSGITLVATTGNGFPNFTQTFTLPPAPFDNICSTNPNMQCAAVATILAYFGASSTGGNNAKGTQTSGMEAARAITPGNLGVAGVQYLAQVTASNTTPSTQILGGSQFNTSFSNDPLGEGTSAFPPNNSDLPTGCSPGNCSAEACQPIACIPSACLAPGITQADLSGYTQFSQVPNKDVTSPEQAEYNVLNVYFNTTAAAPDFGGTPGTPPGPLNYLQIYSPDILYAMQHTKAALVVETNGNTVSLTAQDMLNTVSQDLQQIAEWPLSVPPAGLSIGLAHTGAFHQSQQGLTYSINVSDGAGASPTSSLVTVTETLPSSMTLVSMSGTGWGCSSNQCVRTDSLTPGSIYPGITVTVNVASNAPAIVTNQATVWGGGSPSATLATPHPSQHSPAT